MVFGSFLPSFFVFERIFLTGSIIFCSSSLNSLLDGVFFRFLSFSFVFFFLFSFSLLKKVNASLSKKSTHSSWCAKNW